MIEGICEMEKENNIDMEIVTPRIIAAGISDTGCVRTENEDSIWLDESGLVLLLADGMGGHDRGAEASRTVIDIFRQLLTPDVIKKEMGEITAAAGVPPEISCLYTIIFRAVGKTAAALSERNQELKLNRYMGTTIVGLVLVDDNHVLWFHIGDSRLYRWREGTLKCLTSDHSAYAEWADAGGYGTAPAKNVITRVIGIDPGVEADIEWDKKIEDDIFILCSDGLTDMITDEQIVEVLKEKKDIKETANLLVNAALAAGGKDNVSVIACMVK
jgi:protein phosphatase